MKAKKIINICLCLITAISLLTSYNIKAAENRTLYYKTLDSPLADEYVSNNIGIFLNAEAQETMFSLDNISVGSGIYIENFIEDDGLPMFYYPVLLDNTLKYVFRIYDDGTGNYTGAFSQNYAKEVLENGAITMENAVIWALSNGNELALNKGGYKIINNSPFGENIHQETINDYPISRSKKLYSIDVMQKKLNFKKYPQTRAYKETFISYPETQGSNNWCLGYVTTSAIRTLSGNSSVRTSNMASTYGVPASNGFSWSNVSNYCSRYGVSFAGPYNGTVFITTIANELLLGKLLLGAYQNGGRYHALLIHGVNGNSIKVWNPWYSYSEWILNPTTYNNKGYAWSMYAYGMYR